MQELSQTSLNYNTPMTATSLKFNHVGLLTNHQKELATETHNSVYAWLATQPLNISVLEYDKKSDLSKIDLIIAIGGDGTMLHAARLAAPNAIPLVGINRGYLGFLADIPPDAFEKDLQAILQDQGKSEERVLLNAKLLKQDTTIASMIALNDVVLKHENSGRMMHFSSSINDDYVNTHYGDGVIIATPTGSTAYALSCGGPIISPGMPAISITPICPHTLSDRPLIVSAESRIELSLEERAESGMVSVDGSELGRLEQDMLLQICKAKETLTLLHPPEHSYFTMLRGKLHWGRQQTR